MNRLTLSFDNGPDAEVTPRVLDILRERRLRAHFFVVGSRLAGPEAARIVARAVDEGHLVGNHSFSHHLPLGSDPRPDAVEQEIGATEALLAPWTGGGRRFRPFGGGGALGPHLLTQRAVDYLVAQRYSCVLWSSVPRDWSDPAGWPERALADCAAQSHALLVLHDIPNACAAKLGEFLDRVGALGVEVVAELPLACTPILEGRPVGDLRGLVS
jgi:peptidoglycan/xylan/chitin deacetylase (PgdA/CDA1 family)